MLSRSPQATMQTAALRSCCAGRLSAGFYAVGTADESPPVLANLSARSSRRGVYNRASVQRDHDVNIESSTILFRGHQPSSCVTEGRRHPPGAAVRREVATPNRQRTWSSTVASLTGAKRRAVVSWTVHKMPARWNCCGHNVPCGSPFT